VSKERARRRAEREAARAVADARRQRLELRRKRRRALLRRIKPRVRRRGSLAGRRSPGQRALIAGVAIGLLWTVFYFVDAWPLRIAFTVLILLSLPVFAVVTFDRRGMKL
jgi:Flp pilus assembly protein TadB